MYNRAEIKGEFTQYPFFVRFRPFFFRFWFSLTKSALFHPHFYVSISALIRQSHTGQKFSEKNSCKGVQLYFEISLLSFIHKNFEQNFYLYIIVYLVRIWTYKNADEKAHTFSRRSKNVKNGRKRTKNGYCVNSGSTTFLHDHFGATISARPFRRHHFCAALFGANILCFLLTLTQSPNPNPNPKYVNCQRAPNWRWNDLCRKRTATK